MTERPKGVASWASSDAVRRSMKSNRSRDTKPELRLRKMVHAQGLRYRVAAPPIPGIRRTADLLFTRAKIAVFMDGCFWHGCPEHHTVAVAHAEFWADKVKGNVARDRDTDERLAEAGWISIRIWEHDDPREAALRVRDAVHARRRPAPR